MTPIKQQLFQRFPLDSTVRVAGEELTTPYHIYNGTMLSLGGTVDGNAAARFLADEHLEPVLDTDGRALAAMWVCDFTQANLDAHHELQISLFATRHKVPPIKANTFSYHRASQTIPDLMMVCHGLWNNTERVVRYNAEHLLLNARLTKSEMDFSGETWTFSFRDTEGAIIAEGAVPAIQSQPASVAWKLAWQVGMRGFLELARAPYFQVPVVNTRRPGDPCNHVCTTFTVCEQPKLREATEMDRIVIRDTLYEELDFSVSYAQILKDIGFIFLRPVPLAIG